MHESAGQRHAGEDVAGAMNDHRGPAHKFERPDAREPVSEVCVGQVERKRRDKNVWSEMQAFALYVRIGFVQPNA